MVVASSDTARITTAVDFVVFLAEKLQYTQIYSSCIRLTAVK